LKRTRACTPVHTHIHTHTYAHKCQHTQAYTHMRITHKGTYTIYMKFNGIEHTLSRMEASNSAHRHMCECVFLQSNMPCMHRSVHGRTHAHKQAPLRTSVSRRSHTKTCVHAWIHFGPIFPKERSGKRASQSYIHRYMHRWK